MYVRARHEWSWTCVLDMSGHVCVLDMCGHAWEC